MTTRRTVFASIAAALLPGPLAAQAPTQGGIRRLGVLMTTLASDPTGQARAAAFVQGLGALGWKEGGNLHIDWRWGGGDPSLFERYAAELVALGPEVLMANARSSVAALRRETSTIPIVFVNVGGPVEQGFVESVARPGGNVTGFANFDPPMAGKWLEMLTQIAPPVARVAILYNPVVFPGKWMLQSIEEAARSLAVAVRAMPVNDDAELEAMMAGLAREEHAGVLVLPDPFTGGHRDAIIALAARHRLPAVYPFRFFIASGGLMSYGPDIEDIYRRSAAYVDRILKGTKPSELPVQYPTKFELVINLRTAKALGVTIPQLLLATADEVIE
jgi:putative ABC transport system substrate-binding protein